MLIPSIDLLGGRIVQLVQGEKLALASADFDGWIAKFEGFPKVQLIDLDAAKNQGHNRELVASICRRLPCRVGGGVRSVEDVTALLGAGATKVIVGSRLFRGGAPDLAFAQALAGAAGAARLIQTLLFNVQPLDPLVYLGVAVVFTIIASLACLVPSMRASRIDPLVALRE